MLSRNEYVRISLELNLFFQRIMKEHLFFIQTNLPPVEAAYIDKANELKICYEKLLTESVFYANGVISQEAIESNEIVTPFTLRAEEINSSLTGASINTGITMAELELVGNQNPSIGENLEDIVNDLNNRTIDLLKETITFQTRVLSLKSECKIFVSLYDEMLEHDTREAIYYSEMLTCLQERKLSKKTLCEVLDFWNNIMGEHAQFVDGMLDPTEETLKEAAENFARKFERLVEKCIKTAEKMILKESLESTLGIRDYKKTATEGLLECEIKSIIPPLLADHVLREANHYLRVLKTMKK